MESETTPDGVGGAVVVVVGLAGLAVVAFDAFVTIALALSPYVFTAEQVWIPFLLFSGPAFGLLMALMRSGSRATRVATFAGWTIGLAAPLTVVSLIIVFLGHPPT